MTDGHLSSRRGVPGTGNHHPSQAVGVKSRLTDTFDRVPAQPVRAKEQEIANAR